MQEIFDYNKNTLISNTPVSKSGQMRYCLGSESLFKVH